MNYNEYNFNMDSLKEKCLTQEEETRLIRIIQNGEDRHDRALEKLIDANMYWTVMFTKKYMFSKLEQSELLSRANEGLVKSVDSFDPKRGGHLHEYAVYKMSKCIREAITQYGYEFKLPAQIMNQINKLSKVVSGLSQKLQHEPTAEETAEEMNIPVEEVLYLQSLNQHFQNIEATRCKTVSCNNNDEVSDDGDYGNQVDGLPITSDSDSGLQDTCLDFYFLPPLDREILIRSRGLNGFSPMPHEEILKDINNDRRKKGLSLLTMEDIQIHYNRAVLLDKNQD